jgi:choline-sulfatase
LIAIAILVTGWWLWRGRTMPLRSDACHGCNVLLITIDTLRLDRVGAFGGRGGLTPNLDRLAADGLRLTRAYSAAPLTLPSHASILTAVSPPVHGLRANGLFRLGPNIPTLATVLKSAGYRTGAFVGSFVLDARFGLNRGFDEYDDKYGEKIAGDAAEGAERRAEDVVRPAAAWILSGGLRPPTSGPWFAWVHLYDPHEPYRAPEPYASQHAPYDAEVAYTDAMVGKLLTELRAGGYLDRTLVMVAADHGESLGEHGERTHGVFTYDVTMRVPWIIAVPGSRSSAPSPSIPSQGRSSDALVRLIDLAPTALDLLGVAAPASFEGRSVIPAIASPANETSAAYIEAMDANLTRNWAPLTGLVTRDFKLIDLPIPELYDLAADPHETTNLFTRDAARARTLDARLREMTAGFQSRGSVAEKTTLSADARQRLQALGYVASSADPGARAYTDADDPKTLIGPSNDLDAAVKAFNAGAHGQAMAAARTIIAAHPAFSTARGQLASMQRQSGDLAGAIATLEDMVRRGIADQRVMVVLAGYLGESGAPAKALDLLDAVVASHPDDADAHNSLGVMAMRLGRHDRARAEFRKVIELDPTSATAYANLATDELASRDLAAAIGDLTRSLDLEPRNYTALFNRALAFDALGRQEEARRDMTRFVAEAPPQRYAPDIAQFRTRLDEKK